MQNTALLYVQKYARRTLLWVLCAVCLLGAAPAFAKNVYENQTPITDTELVSFIKLLPQFRAWAASNKEVAHPSLTDGKADFVYSDAAAQWVQTRGFEPKRFFSVMGKAAAALYLISEGVGPDHVKPKDMPQVVQSEIDLVHKHLTQLLEAGSDAPRL